MIATPAQEAQAQKRETPVGAGATQETSELPKAYITPAPAQGRFTDPVSDEIIKGWLCQNGTTYILEQAPDFLQAWVSRQTACIFEACRQVEGFGDNPNIITITDALRMKGRLQEAGGASNIVPGNESWAVVQSALDKLRACYQQKQAAIIGKGLSEGTVTPADALSRLEGIRELEADSPLDDYQVPAPILSPEALFGIAGGIVRKLEPETEAHPASLLLQLLAGMGSLIGRSPYFMAGGNSHHANLFIAIVGDSSKARKGTSWAYIRGILSEVDPTWWPSRIKNGLASGEGIVADLKDGEDDAPRDKRLFIMEEEMAQVLQAMNRTGNTLSATLRNAWDSGYLNNMSKGEPATASNCHISLIGHITRTELRTLLTQNDAANGFANRVLWVHSARTRLLPDGGANLDFSEEIQALQGIADASRKLGAIGRSPEAKDYWASIYPELAREDVPGLWGKATSRAEAQVVRLSMLYALLDLCERIKLEHIKAAKALWDYCFESARWALEDCRFSRDAQRIYDALRKGRPIMTRTQIQREVFKNHLTNEQWTAAIGELAGVVTVEKQGTGGKPITIVSLAG